MITVILVLLSIFVPSVLLGAGFFLGYKFRELQEVVRKIRGQFDAHLKEAEAEDEGSAVVTTTPGLLDKKRREGKPLPQDDEDSAIVITKTPRQIAQDEQAKIDRELDEIQGHSSRIG